MTVLLIDFIYMLSPLQKAISVIGAHDSVLAAMNFSQSGEKLATASEKVC